MAASAEVSFEAPSPLELPADIPELQHCMRRLSRIEEAADMEAALRTLFRLVDGVIAAPKELKRRRVKKKNDAFHRSAGRYSACIDFLRGVGFLDCDDPDLAAPLGRNALLSMPVAYMVRLADAHHILAAFAAESGVEAPEMPKTQGIFNPLQSNRQSTDGSRNASGDHAWRGEAKRLRLEVQNRKRELEKQVAQGPAVELNPTAFWQSAGRRLEDVVREAASIDAAATRTTDNELLKEQAASVKTALANTTANFRNADKRRLVELSKTKVHTCCVLRVVCPDKSVLQATFRATAKGEDVMEQLAPLLAQTVRDSRWYLYQSPPLRRLAAGETLAAAGLTPGANVYLGFEGEKPGAPYLEADLVAEMGPPPS